MNDFIEHKEKEDRWHSPPFYTNKGGYLMCLAVDAYGAGHGENPYVSVGIRLMAGENDDNLQWPFRGSVTFSLLNQRGDHHHITYTIPFSEGVPNDICARVVSGEVAERGWGLSFITHDDLAYNEQIDTEYLKNDSLHLRIKQATTSSSLITSKLPSWHVISTPPVAEFTISEFSKHKALGDAWHSQSFFTHPKGYKFNLVVYANGHGSGEGTHIGVGIQMMKGEYDEALMFPFRGTFTFEIMNWQKDKNHVQDAVSITDDNDSHCKAGGRVTVGEHAAVAKYISNVLPHTSLPYNSITNAEYLNDNDCIKIRVVKVKIII